MTEDGSHIEQQYKLPKEETKLPIDFANLDLWEFAQNNYNYQNDNCDYEIRQTGNVNINGEIFKICYGHQHTIERGIKKDERDITINIIDIIITKQIGDDIVIMGEIRMDDADDAKVNEAVLKIERPRNQTDNSVKGQGIELYNKLLDLLQCLANNSKQPIHHIVRKLSPMSSKKWHAKFDPVLETKQYHKIKNDKIKKWEKTYYPTPKELTT